jgi:hypothetical protein
MSRNSTATVAPVAVVARTGMDDAVVGADAGEKVARPNINLELTPMLEGSLKSVMRAYGRKVIVALAEHYGFDAEEAIRFLDIDNASIESKKVVRKSKKTSDTETTDGDSSDGTVAKKTRKSSKKAKAVAEPVEKAPPREKPSTHLPFVGIVRDDWCHAIKRVDGLYTQCTNEIMEGGYCKACFNQAQKNENKKPNFGDIRERVEAGEEWADPKGRKPVPYARLMKKFGATQEVVKAELLKFFEYEADDSLFEMPEPKPKAKKEPKAKKSKKSKKSDDEAESDEAELTSEETQDEAEDEKPKKRGRGRPKTTKKVETSDDGDEIIAKMVANAFKATVADDEAEADDAEFEETLAAAGKKPKKDETEDDVATIPIGEVAGEWGYADADADAAHADEEEEEEEEEEEAEKEVEVITYNKKKYLRDSDGVVYDFKTHEPIGEWIEVKGKGKVVFNK